MKKLLLIIVAVLAIAVSVFVFQPSKSVHNDLVLAEKLMSDEPDSALHILEKVNSNSLMGENRALYALLMTQAQFKNHKRLDSDSLFKFAYSYYVVDKDSLRKAQVYFYQGRIFENSNNLKEALNYYQKASIAAKNTNDYSFLALIHSRWGALFFRQNLFDDALAIQNKSLKYSLLSNDTLKQIYNYRDIGIVYSAEKKYDLALLYYNKALNLAEFINNTDRLSDICASIGYLYKCMSKYDLGIVYINKSILLLSDSTVLCHRYLLKGNLFILNQQHDSAFYYLNLGKKNSNIAVKAGYSSLMSKLEESIGNYKNALAFSNKYIMYTSKIINTERESALAELQKKYDYSLIKNENSQLELEKKNKNILILTILVVFIVAIWIITYRYFKVRRMNDKIIKLGKEQLDQVTGKLIEREMELEEVLLKSKLDLDNFVDWVLTKNEVMRKIEELTKMETNARISNKKKMELTPKEIENLKEVVNICFDNFAVRLIQRFPDMKEDNVQYCCLLKMKVPADIIAILLGVNDGSLIKRKYRLKKEISGKLDGCSNLEQFFLKF